MADTDSSVTQFNRRPRLLYSRENFADYWTALHAQLCRTEECDQLVSGRLSHPLVALADRRQGELYRLGVLAPTAEQLDRDPIGCCDEFIIFLQQTAGSLQPPEDPPVPDWDTFLADYAAYKAALRKIYAIIINTLTVGSSMHYARGIPPGSGLCLLRSIRDDNIQNTTRALMAVFSNLISVAMKPAESFEAYSRRFELLINRLAGWSPPIYLKLIFIYFNII